MQFQTLGYHQPLTLFDSKLSLMRRVCLTYYLILVLFVLCYNILGLFLHHLPEMFIM